MGAVLPVTPISLSLTCPRVPRSLMGSPAHPHIPQLPNGQGKPTQLAFLLNDLPFQPRSSAQSQPLPVSGLTSLPFTWEIICLR